MWEIISKEDVAKICGVRPSDIVDQFYTIAVSLIESHAGVTLDSSPTEYTESVNGDGTSIAMLSKKPVLDVLSVSIDGVSVSSDKYGNDGRSVYLKDDDKFPVGNGNISISYRTRGHGSYNKYSIVVALLVKEIMSIVTGEGAESRVQFYRPGQSFATDQPLSYWGTHGKIQAIVERIVGERFLAE